MKRITEVTAVVFLFLAGFITGIILSIVYLGPEISSEETKEIAVIFNLPMVYYIVGILVAISMALLLRAVARRLDNTKAFQRPA